MPPAIKPAGSLPAARAAGQVPRAAGVESFSVRALIIGGGGAGGSPNSFGGGGGSGEMLDSANTSALASLTLYKGKSYRVYVGAGGTGKSLEAGSSGEPSAFGGYVAGGGAGAPGASTNQNGTAGACGSGSTNQQSFGAVSYTHLTLPTIYSV